MSAPLYPAANEAVLQASAPAAVLPFARHPEERVSIAIKASYQAGYHAGEATFYVKGWRAGVFSGLWLGALLGGCAVGGLIKLGAWWPW